MAPVKCPFCNPLAEDIVARNDLCYVRWDIFPVSKGHLLIIPFRHVPDFFLLTIEEKQAMVALVDVCKGVIEENFQPAGYNIGINIGAADRADRDALPLPYDPPVCRGCPECTGWDTWSCAGEEGVLRGIFLEDAHRGSVPCRVG